MEPGPSQGETVNLILLLIVYGVPFVLLFFGGVVGTLLERNHLASIRRREAETGDLPAVPTRSLEPGRIVVETRLVSA